MNRAAALLCLALPFPLSAQDIEGDPFGLEGDDPPPVVAADKTTADLAATARPSMVVITQQGRDGATAGTGSGFVVSEDGLIATCAHVIGESRPVSVRFEDGKEQEVTAIHAWDRKLDLAVLRIDAKGLKALPLASDDPVQQGDDVVAMGNPHGLDFSIDEKDYAAALSYVDLLLAIDPDDALERLSRALLNVQTGDGEAAKPDLEWLFDKEPEGIHLDRLRELYKRL